MRRPACTDQTGEDNRSPRSRRHRRRPSRVLSGREVTTFLVQGRQQVSARNSGMALASAWAMPAQRASSALQLYKFAFWRSYDRIRKLADVNGVDKRSRRWAGVPLEALGTRLVVMVRAAPSALSRLTVHRYRDRGYRRNGLSPSPPRSPSIRLRRQSSPSSSVRLTARRSASSPTVIRKHPAPRSNAARISDWMCPVP
jgi:hypothetical protein